MSEVITFHALDLSGETGLKLYLRKSDGSLLNTGGDALAEVSSSGMFQATLAEARTGLGSLSVRVCDGTETADNLLYDGFLPEGSTVIGAGVELDSVTAQKITNIDTFATRVTTGLVQDGLVWQFTANMLELGPAGSGGGGGATEANQLTIIDKIDTYASSALATVNGTSGTIVGFPTTLNVGDSYTDEANSAIHVFIRDANDDPITSVGDFEFTDGTFAPKLIVTQSGTTSRVKATISYVDPGSAESYLKVQIPSSESRRVSPGVATMQCILQWVDTDGKVLCQKTLAKQAVTWNEMI